MTSQYWHTLDAAFYDIAEGIHKAVSGELSSEKITGTDTANNQSASDIQPLAIAPGQINQLVQSEPAPVDPVPSAVPIPSASSAFDILPSSMRELLPSNISQQPQKRGISRRAAMVGTIGLVGAVVIGGSLTWVVSAITRVPRGTTFLIYRGHSSIVAGVTWSPDGKSIASSSYDHTVQVWDATMGQTLLIYRGHSNVVFTVAWSPDGKSIASGSQDATVQVWDAAAGSLIFTNRGHIRSVFRVV